jgi:hypothetical protein
MATQCIADIASVFMDEHVQVYMVSEVLPISGSSAADDDGNAKPG